MTQRLFLSWLVGQLCSVSARCARWYPLFELCLSRVWALLWWWYLRQATASVQRASAERSPSGRISPFVCLSWQDVETEGSINIKGSFRWFQALISSYQLVKPGDKPNSLVMTAIIIRHLLCSLCSLYPWYSHSALHLVITQCDGTLMKK